MPLPLANDSSSYHANSSWTTTGFGGGVLCTWVEMGAQWVINYSNLQLHVYILYYGTYSIFTNLTSCTFKEKDRVEHFLYLYSYESQWSYSHYLEFPQILHNVSHQQLVPGSNRYLKPACHILKVWMLSCVIHSFAIKKAKKAKQLASPFLLSNKPSIAIKCYKGLHCISDVNTLHANKYVKVIQVLSTRQSPVQIYCIQVRFFTEARVKFCHITQKILCVSAAICFM